MKKYYTYAHYKADTKELFYIGKGVKSRHCKATGRNLYWSRIVAKHGFKSEILSRFDTEKEALDHEAFLIECFRAMGFKLANLADGGQGQSGWTISEQHKEAVRDNNRKTKLKYRVFATCISTGEITEYLGRESLLAAGFHDVHVHECCIGKAKTHKGYTFIRELL